MPGWPDWQRYITQQPSWDVLGAFNTTLPAIGVDIVNMAGLSFYESVVLTFKSPTAFTLEVTLTNTTQVPNVVRGIQIPVAANVPDRIEIPAFSAQGDVLTLFIVNAAAAAVAGFQASAYGLPKARSEFRSDGFWLPLGRWVAEFAPTPPFSGNLLNPIAGWRYLLHSATLACKVATTTPAEGMRFLANQGGGQGLIGRVDGADNQSGDTPLVWPTGILCDVDTAVVLETGSVDSIDIGITYDIVA